MQLRFQTHPPLGQVTRVETSAVHFQAIIEVPQGWTAEAWDVVLWYSEEGGDWQEAAFSPSSSADKPFHVGYEANGCTVISFDLELQIQSSIQFTARLRHNHQGEWLWANGALNQQDGRVVKDKPFQATGPLRDLIPDLNSQWKAKSLSSQTPGTQLWALEVSTEAAQHDRPSSEQLSIGTPWGSFLRWFALARQTDMWLGPRHGSEEFELDKDAILCSFLGPSGRNLVFLALSGVHDTEALFKSGTKGVLECLVSHCHF